MAVYSANEGQVTDLRWGSFVLLGLLAIVFGLLIAFFPQMTTLIMIELIGIFLVIVSFGAIMMSAVAPGGLKGSILLAIIGIIGFFFGIATILSPYVMGKAIFILAGIALLIGGILGLVLAISEKEMAHRGLFALQGILSIILGCLIIAGPVIGAALLVLLLGTYFVVWGILSVIMGFVVRSARKA
jgi:uncharacterized membrane protein HdeD (DUF308 family)